MTALLDPSIADRLVKLLGMLSSDYAGERASAGAKADQLIRASGLTWRDVIWTFPRSMAPLASTVEDLIEEALRDGDGIINVWDESFLRGVRGRQHLTRKQLAKLDSIVAKVRCYAGAP